MYTRISFTADKQGGDLLDVSVRNYGIKREDRINRGIVKRIDKRIEDMALIHARSKSETGKRRKLSCGESNVGAVFKFSSILSAR